MVSRPTVAHVVHGTEDALRLCVTLCSSDAVEVRRSSDCRRIYHGTLLYLLVAMVNLRNIVLIDISTIDLVVVLGSLLKARGTLKRQPTNYETIVRTTAKKTRHSCPGSLLIIV